MGRMAIVTGGTRGIGAAIAQSLHANGYNVTSTYVGNERAANNADKGIARKLSGSGRHSHFWTTRGPVCARTRKISRYPSQLNDRA